MERETTGELLKRLLAQKGMSQRRLAILSGVDRGYINSLIKGKGGSITLRLARQFAEALGESPTIFLEEVAKIEKAEDLLREALTVFPDAIPIYPIDDFAVRASGGVLPIDFVYRKKSVNQDRNLVGCFVRGNCLTPAIQDGDILIVDDNEQPQIGNYIVCVVDDELMVGRLTLIDNIHYLENNHGRFKLDECQVAAPVIEVRRRLK